LTEVAFDSYQIGLDSLRQTSASRSKIEETTTWEYYLISQTHPLNHYAIWNLQGRWMEILRMYAMCLLAAVLTAFPRGRRTSPVVPLEIFIVVIAFLDRIVTDQVRLFDIEGLSGISLLLIVTAVNASWRLADRYLPRFWERPA